VNSTPNLAHVLSRNGFKQITPANVLQHDDHPTDASRLREKWVTECLKPKLQPGVPEEVAFLFEIARGSLIYAIFFLPLASLATEESFRVLEAGVRHRCKQLGLAKKKSAKANAFPDKPYLDLVTALHKAGKIPNDDLKPGGPWSFCEITFRIGLHRRFARGRKLFHR
jgi:hypothetical protein